MNRHKLPAAALMPDGPARFTEIRLPSRAESRDARNSREVGL